MSDSENIEDISPKNNIVDVIEEAELGEDFQNIFEKYNLAEEVGLDDEGRKEIEALYLRPNDINIEPIARIFLLFLYVYDDKDKEFFVNQDNEMFSLFTIPLIQKYWNKMAYRVDINDVPFYIPQMSFSATVMPEFVDCIQSLNNKPTVPKNVALFLLYILNKYNMKHLHKNIQKIIKDVKAMFEIDLDEIFEDYDKAKESLDENDVVLSEVGQDFVLIILGMFAFQMLDRKSSVLTYRLYDQTAYITEDDIYDEDRKVQLAHYVASRYQDLCTLQESHFQTLASKITVPYALSEWDKEQPIPWLLQIIPQSLRNLRITESNEGKLDCIPCAEQYERYRGATLYGKHKGRLEVSDAKTYGYCIQTLDLVMELAKADPNYKKTPWYLKWVGTQEEAQQRLDNFKKTQTALYDANDERYNFLNYYSTLIRLRADLAIKKFYKISAHSYPYESPQEGAIEKWAAKWVGPKAKYVIQLFKELGNIFVSNVSIIFIKVLTLILNSPFMVELLQHYIKTYIDEMCLTVGFTEIRQKLVKEKDGTETLSTTGPKVLTKENGVYKQFFYEQGRWIDVPKEEQAKLANRIKKEDEEAWMDKAFGIFQFMQGYLEEGKWKKMTENAALMNSPTFNGFLALLEGMPFVGKVFQKVGRDNVKKIIVGHLQVQGSATLRRIVKVNNQYAQILRLGRRVYEYITIYMTQSCATDVLLLEGRIVGKHIMNDLGKHFHSALYNLPYYAMLVACEIDYLESKGVKVDRQKIIQQMIQLCVVGAAVNEYDGTEKFSNSSEDKIREQASVLYSKIVNIEKEIQETKRNSKSVVDAFTADRMREDAIIDLENFLGRNEATGWLKDFEALQEQKYELVPYAKMDSPNFLQTLESDVKYKTFWQKHWKTIAAGGAILAVGAAVVTLGGPTAAATVAYNAVAGSAAVTNAAKLSGSIGQSLFTRKTELLAAAQSLDPKWIKEYFTASTSGKDVAAKFLAEKVAEKGGGVSGTKIVSDAIQGHLLKGNVTNALLPAVQQVGAMYGTQIIKYGTDAFQEGKDFFQENFAYSLDHVLNSSPTRRLVFISKLNEFLDRFLLKSKTRIADHEFFVMKLAIMEKNSIDVPFVVGKESRLNVPEISKFFKQYGKMKSKMD